MLLPYAPTSVAVARQRLSADLEECGVFTAAIEDAVLVVSELLSNALRHAHPLPSGQIKATWDWANDHLEVTVSDGGATTEPRAARPALSSLGGRGLGIVEFLAERWGVRHDGEMTTVWAVLHAPVGVLNSQVRTPEIGALHECG
ncbi:ATP-binding protein [Sphaerisporangium siamense]|uniref:Anti-sigma regulatory factor (Ser/Thr protein kinase) n=1 Tax=Sphaerisporangium siamense TaxID=795645 RepID=A0A7W7D478_9ACTN|nr:ATP-binding protein [Sphaerisporangium siamense]MBB4700007.1 anti-sigma regulatory factor (Ser/Thr protein kinase) [Sphaerisporangium siamense]